MACSSLDPKKFPSMTCVEFAKSLQDNKQQVIDQVNQSLQGVNVALFSVELDNIIEIVTRRSCNNGQLDMSDLLTAISQAICNASQQKQENTVGLLYTTDDKDVITLLTSISNLARLTTAGQCGLMQDSVLRIVQTLTSSKIPCAEARNSLTSFMDQLSLNKAITNQITQLFYLIIEKSCSPDGNLDPERFKSYASNVYEALCPGRRI